MSDRIEKSVEMKAPVAKVWGALTNHEEFGKWFRVKIDAPFREGELSRGRMIIPGYEHLRWEALIQKIVPESLFSFTWHPYPNDPAHDYSNEPPTLVEFMLKETAAGTLLRVVESGFDKIPAGRRAEAFRMNEGGWTGQMKNIAAYVERTS